MKKILSILLLFSTAQAGNFYGGETPFPWGREILFPWRQIEGNWNVEKDSTQSRFSFDVVHNHEDGVRVVHVAMYDEQGQVYARGSGVAGQDARIVRAIMSSVTGNTFLLFVRAFRDSKTCRSGGQIIVVVTERPLEAISHSKDNNYVIYKPIDPSICSSFNR